MKVFKFYVNEKREWGSQNQEKAGLVFADDKDNARIKIESFVLFTIGKIELNEVDIIEFPDFVYRDMEFSKSEIG
jgi:hypothetical protein